MRADDHTQVENTFAVVGALQLLTDLIRPSRIALIERHVHRALQIRRQHNTFFAGPIPRQVPQPIPIRGHIHDFGVLAAQLLTPRAEVVPVRVTLPPRVPVRHRLIDGCAVRAGPIINALNNLLVGVEPRPQVETQLI